jgi:serine/threonine protein phosphatase 1
LAIGDVHGCLTALDTLLGFVRPGPADQLVFLGDYIDRGPDSKGVLDRLLELRRKFDVVNLRGNHEVMMLAAATGWDNFRFWRACGGVEALESYAGPDGAGTLDDIPDAHWHFVENRCVDWYETESHVFVHANLHPDFPLGNQPTDCTVRTGRARQWSVATANSATGFRSNSSGPCASTPGPTATAG